MADNVSGGLPNAGKTYHGGTPSSVGRSVELEGTEIKFRDEVRNGASPRTKRSGEFRYARLVRNTSSITLEPKRTVTWQAGYRHRRVDGYSRLDGVEVAGVVDPDLPATGVKPNDLFWCFFRGPVPVKTPVAGNATNVFSEGDVIGALTAATSGADAAGRVGKVATASTALAGSDLINRVGRVMSAMTTAQTNADMLVALNIQD
jgi:hypothetical protein